MDNKKMLKSLTDEEINNLDDKQLFNIVFGPILNLEYPINKVPKDENNKDKSIAIILGATVKPIKRRLTKFYELFKSGYNPYKIMLCGGKGWKRAKTASTELILHCYPELEDELLKDCIKREKLKLNDKQIQDAISSFTPEYKNGILNKRIMQMTEAELMAWILNSCKHNENEDYSRINKKDVILETQSEYTNENANNCIGIIESRLKANKDLDIDNMVVFNEWQYLSRAYLTIKKSMKNKINQLKNGNEEDKQIAEKLEKIKLYAEPAEYGKNVQVSYNDIKEFRTMLKTEVKKMRDYDDVDDIDISKFINAKKVDKKCPTIEIRKVEHENMDREI